MNHSAAKKWDEKITDKHFLKQNDFAEAVSRSSDFMKQYKMPVLLLAFLLLVLLVGVPTYHYYHDTQVLTLNEKLFEAKKSLKKEQSYQDILQQYQSLPAAKLANIELASYYIDHQDSDKALTVLDAGLKNASADIMGTILVLKKFDVLKTQQKFKEAVDFLAASESKVLPTFVPRLRLLTAAAYLDAGNVESAKKILEALASATQVADKTNYAADVVDEAKDQLTLLNLGLL